ncbi:aldose epimerase family protein [Falsiroseomonas selenitidurans]|uniref:Aldose epimerase n=1 Tax=Falsiroseomonas selenitidurans TaxID=2716335 RepID=A0ABX1E735_9PROT|nr:aldose epimerase [Falsiroseomonas selenitidurans]NKC32751.1 aldose epimerase [Falsiroseomonas selenitidurans]
MIALAAGDWTAQLLEDQGAALGALAWRGQDIVAPVPPGGHPNLGFHSAFLMAPWTNRLAEGRITVGGQAYRMPINRPAEGHALHGFVREQAWTVGSVAGDAAVLSCTVDHAPFRCTARLRVALAPAGLHLALELTNDGAVPTPMGIGWHPFLTRPAGTRLRFAATTIFGRDARNLAIGPRPFAGMAGGDAVLDGLDTHFAGWDGVAEMSRPGGPDLRLAATGDWARNLQVFAPRGGGVICVEPVSHAPDAVNRPAIAAHGPMLPLAPGASLHGSVTLLLG